MTRLRIPPLRDGRSGSDRSPLELLICSLLVVSLTPLAARGGCTADCSGDGSVAIDELVTCVRRALEADDSSGCAACDDNGDGAVSIAELIGGAVHAVNGCAGPTITPTATPLSSRAPRGTPARLTPGAPTLTPSPAGGCSADGPRPCVQRAPATVGPCAAVALTGNEVTATTVGGTNILGNGEELSCGNNGGGSGALERVYIFTPPAPGQYEISVQGDKFRPLLHLRRQSCQGAFIDCAVDPTTNRRPSLTVTVTAPIQPIAIGVDGDGSTQRGSFTLMVTPRLPDLRVSSFTVPAQAVVGEPVAIELEIENAGDLAAGSFAVEIQYFRDATLTQPLGTGPVSCRIAELAAGATAPCVLDVTLTAPFVAAGPYVVGVTVDAQREVRERGDAADGVNGPNNQTSAPSQVIVLGAVLEQRLFRALDGTVYQLVRVLPSADRTAAEHYRITSLSAGSSLVTSCATSDDFPGGTARAYAGGPPPQLRTAILEPGDVASSFDAASGGRLALGAGPTDIEVCSTCPPGAVAPLTHLHLAGGGISTACTVRQPDCNGEQGVTTVFAEPAMPVDTGAIQSCRFVSGAVLTEICREEPENGFILEPGQSVVFVTPPSDQAPPHLPFSAAIGAFGVTVDDQNDSGCISWQIVEAVALRSDTGRQATLSFVEAQYRRRFDFSSVVVSGDGADVYVSDGSGQVLRFDRNPTTGSLTLGQAVKEGEDAAGLTAGAALALSPDARHLFVASGCHNFCNICDDALVVFARDPVTGALSFVQTIREAGSVDLLKGPSAVAVSPDGAHVYVAVTAGNAVAVFARDATTGRLTFVQVLRGQTFTPNLLPGQLNAPRSIAISANGAQVYVACSGLTAEGGTVAVLTRDAETGSLAPLQVVSAAFRPVGVAVGPGDAQVYVASGIVLTPGVPNLIDGVWTYARNPQTGMLTLLQALGDAAGEIGTVQRVRGLALSPDGANLQLLSAPVSGPTQIAKVANFTRNLQTGMLTFVDNVEIGLSGSYESAPFAFGFARSPAGSHTYVVGGTATRGTVALVGGQSFVMPADGPDGLAGAAAAAFNQSGDRLYVGSKEDGALVTFARDTTTGHLTQLDVVRDGAVSALVVASDSGRVYSLVGDSIRRYSPAPGTTLLQFQDGTMLGSPGIALVLGPFPHRFLYALTASAVRVYERNLLTGTLSLVQTLSESTPGVPLTSTALAAMAIIDADNPYAYLVHRPRPVADGYEMPITLLEMAGREGTLTFRETTAPGGVGPEFAVGGIAIANDTPLDLSVFLDVSVYVARGSFISGVVEVYAPDPNTYSLSLREVHRTGVNGVEGFRRATSLALLRAPDPEQPYLEHPSPFLFVTGRNPVDSCDTGEDAVAVFYRSFDPPRGSLTWIEQQRDGFGRVEGMRGPVALVQSPDGKHLYVVTNVANSVVLFAFND
jgi:6-phosphogluconolactonase (cycloisomerase 2 family)